MYEFLARIQDCSEDGAFTAFEAALETVSKAAEKLPIFLPQLPRMLGREPLRAEDGSFREGELQFAPSAWRVCDAAAVLLISAAKPDAEARIELYRHGDMEERTMLLRTLVFGEIDEACLELLGEVQRTNTAVHFEAGALDSNLIVRALEDGGSEQGFTTADFARLILKTAFMDLPVARIFGALDHATPELSTMLTSFATEREAAGRPVWIDTMRFLGRAPVSGSLARLLGALEDGKDRIRATAIAAFEDLAQDEANAALVQEPLARKTLADRVPREPREALAKRLAALSS